MRRATSKKTDHLQPTSISIHALLAESDLIDTSKDVIKTTNFYPRSPCGERQAVDISASREASISIHALLAESDLPSHCRDDRRPIHFYPRSPCGERLETLRTVSVRKIFLSTLSLRRATIQTLIPAMAHLFLSTLSLRRATRPLCLCGFSAGNFYPRSPCGERLKKLIYKRCELDFYPRSPCGERPRRASRQQPAGEISIHALLAESDCSLLTL